MAKKKEPIGEIKAEEVMEKPIEETAVKEAEADFTEEFIAVQLMNINRMPDRAKAKRLAERVLRNRKG